MKKSILVIAFATLFFSTTWAKVRTVSQDVATPAQYTTVAAAMTASAAGDTIYINGSAIQYPSFTVTQINLTFIGAGYSPTKDNPLQTMINYVYLDTAGNNKTGRGTKLLGLNINWVEVGPDWSNAGAAKNQNVVISRCIINYLDVCGDNWSIYDNVINEYTNLENHANLLISNNIFNSGGYLSNSNQSTVMISNNLFWRYNGTVLSGTFTLSTFTNNIMVGTNTNLTTNTYVTLNNITYNMTYGIFNSNGGENLNMPGGVSGNNTATDNITNEDPMFNFELTTPIVAGTTFSLGYNFALQTGSPALIASSNSTQIGIYGGAYPWVDNTGMVNIPYVQHMTVGAVVPVGGNLNVNVTAKTHN
jgi:hypothetical protein